MNKILVALIVSTLASIAVAQTATQSPRSKDKQKDVQAATQLTGDNSGNAGLTAAEQRKNVNASKQVTKLTKQEKSELAKDSSKRNTNPNNSAGAVATAEMQRQTTAASRGTGRQNVEFKTKEGQQQLDKDLRSKSTP